MTNHQTGDVYITVNGNTRITSTSITWLKAIADVLNYLNHRASNVVNVCTIHFKRDDDELYREEKLLEEVIRQCGGLTIIDLTEGLKK